MCRKKCHLWNDGCVVTMVKDVFYQLQTLTGQDIDETNALDFGHLSMSDLSLETHFLRL